MTKNERLTIFLSTFSLLTSISFGILTLYQTNKIAEKSGSFDKASPQLLLDEVVLQPNIQNHLYLGISNYTYLDGTILLPFTVYNQGSKSAKMGKVVISYNHANSIFMSEEELGVSSRVENYIPREVIQSKSSIQSLYTLSSIEPNSLRFLNEYIKIPIQVNDTFRKVAMISENKLAEISRLKSKQYTLRIQLSFEDLSTEYYDVVLHFLGKMADNNLQKETLMEIRETKDIVPKRFSLIVANPQVSSFILVKRDTLDILEYKTRNMTFGIYDEVMNVFFQNDKYGKLIQAIEN